MREVDCKLQELKSVMKGFINEHKQDVDYENPRDFIDVYLKQIKDVGDDFEIDHLVVICLDFFQAGAETTRYVHCQFFFSSLRL